MSCMYSFMFFLIRFSFSSLGIDTVNNNKLIFSNININYPAIVIGKVVWMDIF